MSLPRILVVAGLIDDGASTARYLIAQRRPGDHLALQWEFPGGKVELGEEPSLALQRELQEELGIEVDVGDVFAVGHDCCEKFEVIMLTYICHWRSGEPARKEVHAFRWVTVDELLSLPMPPPDQPVLARLRREFVNA